MTTTWDDIHQLEALVHETVPHLTQADLYRVIVFAGWLVALSLVLGAKFPRAGAVLGIGLAIAVTIARFWVEVFLP